MIIVLILSKDFFPIKEEYIFLVFSENFFNKYPIIKIYVKKSNLNTPRALYICSHTPSKEKAVNVYMLPISFSYITYTVSYFRTLILIKIFSSFACLVVSADMFIWLNIFFKNPKFRKIKNFNIWFTVKSKIISFWVIYLFIFLFIYLFIYLFIWIYFQFQK